MKWNSNEPARATGSLGGKFSEWLAAFRTPARGSYDAADAAFRNAHILADSFIGDAWIDYRQEWKAEFGLLVADRSSPRGRRQRAVARGLRWTRRIAWGVASLGLSLFAVVSGAGGEAVAAGMRVLSGLPAEVWVQTGNVASVVGAIALGIATFVVLPLQDYSVRDVSVPIGAHMQRWAQGYWMRRCGVDMALRKSAGRWVIDAPRDPSWDEPTPRWTDEALQGWSAEAACLPHKYLVSYVYSWDSEHGEQRHGTMSLASSHPICSFADVARLTDRIESALRPKGGRYVHATITGWTQYESPDPPPKVREPIPAPLEYGRIVVDLEARRAQRAA